MRPFSVWYELGLLYTSRQEVLVQWIVDFQNKDHGHQVESKTQKLRRTQTVGLLWLRAPLFWPQRMSCTCSSCSEDLRIGQFLTSALENPVSIMYQ